MSQKKPISSNGEILFIYDAEMTNPNGDPDNENKPRMDMLTATNLVTDVRFKRYIRDYLEIYEKLEVYVSNPEGQVLNASDRLRFWQWRKENPKTDVTDQTLKDIRRVNIDKLTAADVLNEYIDTRLFGATIPIKAETGGSSINFVGPVQFNWGKSFNEVELVDSTGITSHFSSGEGAQGTMGTDYRVYYSLLGFYGIITSSRAKFTQLTHDDLELLDKAIVKSIPLLATRSKIGQYPRLYIRIEYNSNIDYIGDLRYYITLSQTKGLRKLSDTKVNFLELSKKLVQRKDSIKSIYYWTDEAIGFELPKELKGISKLLNF